MSDELMGLRRAVDARDAEIASLKDALLGAREDVAAVSVMLGEARAAEFRARVRVMELEGLLSAAQAERWISLGPFGMVPDRCVCGGAGRCFKCRERKADDGDPQD